MRGSLAFSTGLLAGLALDTARRTHQAHSLHPAIGDFVEVDGTRLHYAAEGTGRPVVLIHGAGLLLEDMTLALLPLLSQRYRAVAIDRPGSGYSDRPLGSATPIAQARLIREAVRRLGMERPILVGHSYGALVALAYALEFQDELEGLVLVAPYAFPTPRPSFLAPALAAIPVLGPFAAHTFLQPVSRRMLPGFLEWCFAPNPVPGYVQRGLPGSLLLRPRQIEAVARDLAALKPAALLLQRHYETIRIPTTIVAGREDRVADPERHAQPLYTAIRGSTLDLVPGSGHMVHHIAPDRILTALGEIERRRSASKTTVPAA